MMIKKIIKIFSILLIITTHLVSVEITENILQQLTPSDKKAMLGSERASKSYFGKNYKKWGLTAKDYQALKNKIQEEFAPLSPALSNALKASQTIALEAQREVAEKNSQLEEEKIKREEAEQKVTQLMSTGTQEMHTQIAGLQKLIQDLKSKGQGNATFSTISKDSIENLLNAISALKKELVNLKKEIINLAANTVISNMTKQKSDTKEALEKILGGTDQLNEYIRGLVSAEDYEEADLKLQDQAKTKYGKASYLNILNYIIEVRIPREINTALQDYKQAQTSIEQDPTKYFELLIKGKSQLKYKDIELNTLLNKIPQAIPAFLTFMVQMYDMATINTILNHPVENTQTFFDKLKDPSVTINYNELLGQIVKKLIGYNTLFIRAEQEEEQRKELIQTILTPFSNITRLLKAVNAKIPHQILRKLVTGPSLSRILSRYLRSKAFPYRQDILNVEEQFKILPIYTQLHEDITKIKNQILANKKKVESFLTTKDVPARDADKQEYNLFNEAKKTKTNIENVTKKGNAVPERVKKTFTEKYLKTKRLEKGYLAPQTKLIEDFEKLLLQIEEEKTETKKSKFTEDFDALKKNIIELGKSDDDIKEMIRELSGDASILEETDVQTEINDIIQQAEQQAILEMAMSATIELAKKTKTKIEEKEIKDTIEKRNKSRAIELITVALEAILTKTTTPEILEATKAVQNIITAKTPPEALKEKKAAAEALKKATPPPPPPTAPGAPMPPLPPPGPGQSTTKTFQPMKMDANAFVEAKRKMQAAKEAREKKAREAKQGQ